MTIISSPSSSLVSPSSPSPPSCCVGFARQNLNLESSAPVCAALGRAAQRVCSVGAFWYRNALPEYRTPRSGRVAVLV
eukprot:1140464-Rhodomonas_salina.1